MCIIEKRKKTLSWFSLEPIKNKNSSRYNSIPENFIGDLNMKKPDVLVEIIDLKLCSLLKWDVV